jgi:phosphoribosylformylglycinamidine cyclo-ligase
VSENASIYAQSGVDTAAGDLAVELMKSAVGRTHGPEVLGGVGGFAGMFDASALLGYKRPLLASSTDGVGTKVAIAQAIDKHDTIGQDLVAMVVDDIVVVGAKPLFMTDYIACGKVVPERIADIVRGIAEACEATGTALVGGETAEHPGLLGPDDYDVAGAATGVVEADRMLQPSLVQHGDVVLAMAASGLHSNGFSLVRHILAERGIGYGDRSAELGASYGEALLTPTALYTAPLLRVLEDPSLDGAVHVLSHVTGGGIAANLAATRSSRSRAPGTSESACSRWWPRIAPRRWPRHSPARGSTPGWRARSPRRRATSRASSRARRAWTVARCASSAPTRAEIRGAR